MFEPLLRALGVRASFATADFAHALAALDGSQRLGAEQLKLAEGMCRLLAQAEGFVAGGPHSAHAPDAEGFMARAQANAPLFFLRACFTGVYAVHSFCSGWG